MVEISRELVQSIIVQRPSQSHKGNYGKVLLIGGSTNYGGAIIMATEACVNSGAGLVATATHSVNLDALHARIPEAMFIDWRNRSMNDLIKQMDVIVCGPGLGMDSVARGLLHSLRESVTSQQTVVLDASAIDLIAQDRSLMPENAGKIILTPHQKEWERLSQIRIPYQNDSANHTALNLLLPAGNGILVLKSNHTKVYNCQGEILVNPLGNPGMAIGGMGDTLSGVVGAFCAQFGASMEVAASAVYVHSYAGDCIFKTDYVVRPVKLSAKIPQVMKELSSK
ncbi:NAD(P)H-hydrate dehydratase [Lactobacillus psittaci]|uniref:ADP-dependent (S)-NAD(P)H-hydrate dehydratase n=1 Tax=Lactobacillus psittaci DSM 15354 TaxID=1122152 RepID=A0A0R1SAM2_9LACO|nr:NAD(P)H-hydrate dehydratase [Lactobacillus psittaci]KRL63770.1 carbohydrate kinase [Lactobacillus psittaci DSM 15354]